MQDLPIILGLAIVDSLIMNCGPIGRMLDRVELWWRLKLVRHYGISEDDPSIVHLKNKLKM